MIQYCVPGVVVFSGATFTIPANVDNYHPFFVYTPLIVDQLALEVNGAGAGSTFRMGIYPADTDWQPAANAAPLADSGDITGASTGVKTYTPGTPIYLPRGRYLTVYNCTATAPLITRYDASMVGTPIMNTFASAVAGRLTVSRTNAAFPTPGTAWTTVAGTSNFSFHHPIFLRISQP